MLLNVTISPIYNVRVQAYLKFYTLLPQIQKASIVPNKGVLQLGMPDTDPSLWTGVTYTFLNKPLGSLCSFPDSES